MDVFVYGTLTDPDRVETLLEEYELGPAATLVGCHRVDGRYPTLGPGGAVTGRVLSTPEVEALDAYEGVADGLYVRVEVPVRGGGSVATYVGRPGLLGLGSTVHWSGEGSFEDRIGRYMADESVVVEVEDAASGSNWNIP